MKTIKEVAEITGLSIRTLRYYDEIDLLKPTQVSEAGYRLYDDMALEKLQQILFFRELEFPLADIKEIIGNPNYNKKQALSVQKSLLEHKRNRLNGIIKLISDVMQGINTMSFEAFTDEDVRKIIDHSLELQGDSSVEAIIEKFGSLDAYRTFTAKNLKDEKTSAQLIKIYGSKDKAVDASLQATGNQEDFKNLQEENDKIYKQFAVAKKTDNTALAIDAVTKLAQNYKAMFRVDNARNLLLEMAKVDNPMLAEATDQQYGTGVTEYIHHAIQEYYGV